MKKSKLTRAITFIIVLALAAVSFAACTTPEGPDNDAETTVASGSATDPAAETTAPGPELDEYGREIVEAGIPKNQNFEGRDFTVHTRGNVEQYEWLAEDMNGEVLNDAIYNRNLAVEELLNINLVIIAEGSWSDYAPTTLPKIKASILSGDGAYDLIAGFSTPISSVAKTGLLKNLNDFEYIDFDKPWWSQNIVEELTVNNNTYFGVGSLSLSMIYSMECIFVNNDIFKLTAEPNYNIYETVNNGNWTWDEMIRLSDNAYQDLNGNGAKDIDDRFGLGFCDNTNSIYGFFYGTGTKLITRNASGEPELTYDIEHIGKIVDKAIEMLYNTPSAYNSDSSPALDFSKGTVLFYNHWLYWGQTKYSGLMDDYGIVPMPKFNTAQENYYTPVQAGMHMYCIPIDVKNPEQNGIITEALAAESYKSLVPQYYEIVLKTKYAKDSQTSQMVDIMYDTVLFDFAYIYNNDISFISNIQSTIQSKNNTIASKLATAKKVSDNKLSTLLEAISKVN